MTVIDLLILGSIGTAFWMLIARNRAATTKAISRGALLFLTGLAVTALFFIADLATMHVFPLFMSMGAAMTAMTQLHLEYHWLVALFGVCFVSFGFIAINRNLFQALNELRDIEDRYAFAAAGAHDGLWDWNIRTNHCSYSRRWKATLGYADRDLKNVRETFLSLLHADDRDHVDKALDAHLTKRVPYDVEYRLRHKNGHYIWVWARGQAIWNDRGEPVRMGGSIGDITERKHARELASQAERRLESITDNLSAGIYRRVLQTDGTVVFPLISQGFRKLFDVDPNRVMADSGYLFGRIHSDDLDRVTKAFRVSAKTLETYQEEYRIVGDDGRVRWCRSIAEPREQANGDIVWDGLAVDITERKLSEEALRESEARLRDYADVASDWFWEQDADLRFTMLSLEHHERLGLKPVHYIGKTRRDIVALGVSEAQWRRHDADLVDGV